MAMQQVVSAQRKAIIGTLKCMYFVVIPDELSLQFLHGVDMLEVLTSQYDPHHVIETEPAKQELKIVCFAANIL